MAVVFTHIPRQHHGEFDWLFYAFLPLDFGALGVPLFIVLSGFCIHLAVARRAAGGGRPQLDWLEFWKRRFVRLYPPYVAAIAFSLCAYWILAATDKLPPDQTLRSLGADLSIHLAMLQNVVPEYFSGLFNPAFWTLALEEQLYALFAVVLLLRRRMPVVRVLWIALALMIAWKIGVVWTEFILARYFEVPRDVQVLTLGTFPALGSWENWVFGWWFLWVLGAVAAEAFAGTTRLPAWCYSRIIALVAAAVALPTYFRTLGLYTTYFLSDQGADGWLRVGLQTIATVSEPAFSVACFIMLNRWCRAERDGRFAGRWVRIASSCGLISYSLYLIHFPTLGLLNAFLPIGDRQSLPHTLLRILLYVPLCLAVAYGFFMLVERRFLNRSRAQARAPQHQPGFVYEAR